ncbi:hypothetical protein [Nostoc commune]|uniref:hypothetical protein n=1 Tax=Nostoc commune TaxID=1178 RepID=UPI002072D0E8|nr:hypothetical protein [Nostoc commune]
MARPSTEVKPIDLNSQVQILNVFVSPHFPLPPFVLSMNFLKPAILLLSMKNVVGEKILVSQGR